MTDEIKQLDKEMLDLAWKMRYLGNNAKEYDEWWKLAVKMNKLLEEKKIQQKKLDDAVEF